MIKKLNTSEITVKKGQKNILVVEDSKFFIRIIQKYLEDQNYNIIIAENVFDALSIIEVLIPDVILLDIMMPVINGYSFLKIINCKRTIMNVPVVIISSMDSDFDVARGIASGAESYLKKPFTPKELKSHIVDALGKPQVCNF